MNDTVQTGRGRYDRSKSKAQREQERYDRLLRAATDVFAEHGHAGTTVAMICKRARVSRQTFYEHFDDLQAALLAVYAFSIRSVFAGAEALREVTDPLTRLQLGIAGYLQALRDNASLARVVNRELFGMGPKYVALREAAYGRWVTMLMEGAAQAHADGDASRLPDERTAYALVGGMEALALRYLDRGEPEHMLDAAPVLVEMVWRAFGGDPAKLLMCGPA